MNDVSAPGDICVYVYVIGHLICWLICDEWSHPLWICICSDIVAHFWWIAYVCITNSSRSTMTSSLYLCHLCMYSADHTMHFRLGYYAYVDCSLFSSLIYFNCSTVADLRVCYLHPLFYMLISFAVGSVNTPSFMTYILCIVYTCVVVCIYIVPVYTRIDNRLASVYRQNVVCVNIVRPCILRRWYFVTVHVLGQPCNIDRIFLLVFLKSFLYVIVLWLW